MTKYVINLLVTTLAAVHDFAELLYVYYEYVI